MDFKTLPSNPANGGIQYTFKADNGYGASIVRHDFSYGGKQGLWELAVTKYDGDSFNLCYHTEITDDVMGYLTEDQVNEILLEIQALTA
jgi:hypothetical protein